jgi:hypothetical protein
MPEFADTVRARTRGWIDLVAGIISRAQQDGDLPSGLDATALATILIAATDGLKDLSDILDPPHRPDAASNSGCSTSSTSSRR